MEAATDPKYRKKVYTALKGELGDSFSKSEQEFNTALDTQDGYSDKVYTALKGELGDSFSKSQEEFNDLMLKKKDEPKQDSPSTSQDQSSDSNFRPPMLPDSSGTQQQGTDPEFAMPEIPTVLLNRKGETVPVDQDVANLYDQYTASFSKGETPEDRKRMRVEYLENLPEDQKLKLNNFAVDNFVNLDVENQNLVKENKILGEKAKSLIQKGQQYQGIYDKRKAENGEVPQEWLDNWQGIKTEYDDIVKQLKNNVVEFDNNSDDLGSFQEEISYLKRNYGMLESLTDMATLGMSKVISGLGEAAFLLDDIIPDAVQPLRNEKLVQEAREMVDDLREGEKLFEQTIRPQLSVSEIEDKGDAVVWGLQQLATQLPNIAVIGATGGTAGLVTVGSSAAGQKRGELMDSNKTGETNYSKFQLNAAALAFGGIEAASERITFGIGKRMFKSILGEGSKEFAQQGFKQFTKEFVTKTGYNFAKEGFSEGANQLAQNLIDIHYLDQTDKSVWDGVTDSMASGGFIGGVAMTAAPMAVGKGLQTFGNAITKKTMDNNIKEIEQLKKERDSNPDLSPTAVKEIDKKLESLTKGNVEVLNAAINKVESMTPEKIQEVLDIDKQIRELTQTAQEIQEDQSMSPQTKEIVLDSKNKEFVEKSEKKEQILNEPVTPKTDEAVQDQQTVEPKAPTNEQTQVQEQQQTQPEVQPPKEIVLSEANNAKKYTPKREEGAEISFTDNNGKPVSRPTHRKLRDKYAETVDYTQGDIAPPSQNQDYSISVAENSKNPAEIASVLQQVNNRAFLEENVGNKDRIIAENISKVSGKSFNNFGDKNLRTRSIGKSYLSDTEGRQLDDLAQEMSEDSGTEITEQDIVDFIVNNPNGAQEVYTNVRKEKVDPLKQAFTNLTGLPATDKYIQKALEQQIAKNENASVIDYLDTNEILSLLNEREQANAAETTGNAPTGVGSKSGTIAPDGSRPAVQKEGARPSQSEASQSQPKISEAKPQAAKKTEQANQGKKQANSKTSKANQAKPQATEAVDLAEAFKLNQVDAFLAEMYKNVDKFGKENLGMNMFVPLAKGTILAMQAAVKTAKTSADIVSAGVNYIKSTDYYKNLDAKDQKAAIDIQKQLLDPFKVIRQESLKEGKAIGRKQGLAQGRKEKGRLKERFKTEKTDVLEAKKEALAHIKSVLDNQKIGVATKTNLTNLNSKLAKANTMAQVNKALLAIDSELSLLGHKAVAKDLKKMLKEPQTFLKTENKKLKAKKVSEDVRKRFGKILKNIQKTPDDILQDIRDAEANTTTENLDSSLDLITDLNTALQIVRGNDLNNLTKKTPKGTIDYIDTKLKATELLEDSYNNLQALLLEGKAKFNEKAKKDLAEKTKNREDTTQAILKDEALVDSQDVLTQRTNKRDYTKKGLSPTEKTDKFMSYMLNNVVGKTKGVFNKMEGFRGLMAQLDYSKDNKLKRLADLVQSARRSKDKMNQEVYKELLDGKKKVLGKNYKSISKKLNQRDKKNDLGIFKGSIKDRQGNTIQKSINLNDKTLGQFLQLYMYTKNPTTLEKLKNDNGFSDAAIEAVQGIINKNPEIQKYGDFLVEEFYPNMYKKVNPTYKKMFGVDMPITEMYSPTEVLENQTKEISVDDVDFTTASAMSPNVIARTNHRKPLGFESGAESVLYRYVNNMIQFTTFEPAVRQLSDVFKNEKVRRAVVQRQGKEFMKLVDQHIVDIANDGAKANDLLTAIINIKNKAVTASLALNLPSAMSQIASFPAYMTGAGFRAWTAGTFSSPIKNFKTYKDIMNTPFMKERLERGYNRDVTAQMARDYEQVLSKKSNLASKLMLLTRYGDAAGIILGGVGYVNAKTKQYSKKHSPKKAREMALRDFENFTDSTQQSSSIENLSAYQRNKAGNLFTTYMSSQIQYFQKIRDSVRNIQRGKATWEDGRNLIVYGVVLPALFPLVQGALDFEEDDIEEAIIKGNPLSATLWSMPIIAPMVQHAYNQYKEKPFEFSPLSFGSKINKVYSKGKKFYKTEDPEQLVDALGIGIEMLTGLPYSNVKKFTYLNYQYATGEKEMDDFRNWLMYSRYKTNGWLETTEDVEEKMEKVRAKESQKTRALTKAVKERREGN
ncbi:hypothetical protein [Aquimarina algiphila]|uniref:Large polyvalent protein associated domain-containing protein n=1 Tax=Aquimarina algiphila TaxID=2047982 RepID=A0A554VRI8_9FLAO|nr:hypothetical protein [Aquimarina algiphila]TSE11269.1 hypothetical protein FOF46_01175 [Aquimarina algiphila]